MKTSITILIILVIGMVLGIYIHIEYQKFHPIGDPSGAIVENEDGRVKVTMFVSAPIQTFKGKILQIKTTVKNKTGDNLTLQSKNCRPIFDVSHYYGNKKVDEYNGRCLKEEYILVPGSSSSDYTILSYDQKSFEKYKYQKIAVTVEGVTTKMEQIYSKE